MKTRILIAAVLTSFIAPIAFAQMYGGSSQAQSQKPPQPASGGMQNQGEKTTTTTKTTYPQGVKAYLDQQVAGSKDKKFHVSLNGKDLALTPVKIHEGGKSATPVDMKGSDGKMYEIDFALTNGQVTGARVAKVNGQKP